MPRSPLRAALALGGAALSLASRPAAAAETVLTFSSRACTGQGSTGYGYEYQSSPYDVQGFRLATSFPFSTAFNTPCTGGAGYTGTTTLSVNQYGETVTLTSLAGTPFSIRSIDLAAVLGGYAAQTVTFTGTLVGGATVTQAFTIPSLAAGAAPTLATYTFAPAFTNLARLEMGPQVVPFYQFTNVRLDQATVPEPGTWALLGSGLLALGGVARARRRSAAA